VKELSLEFKGKELSSIIFSPKMFPKLEILTIFHDDLISIPDSLFSLPTLKKFSLDFHSIVKYNALICDCLIHAQNIACTQLSQLILRGLDLQEVPNWIKLLSDLESLDLRSNKIRSLPVWLGGLPKLVDIHIKTILQ